MTISLLGMTIFQFEWNFEEKLGQMPIAAAGYFL